MDSCQQMRNRIYPQQSSILIAQQMQSTTACLRTGKYKFTIIDTAGDGICCAHGQGRYDILVNGDTVHTGDHGGRFETKTFGACPIVDS